MIKKAIENVPKQPILGKICIRYFIRSKQKHCLKLSKIVQLRGGNSLNLFSTSKCFSYGGRVKISENNY